MKLKFLVFLFLISNLFFLSGEAGSSITIRLLPSLSIPLGSSSNIYNVGGGGQLTASFKPPINFPLLFNADIAYGISPFTVNDVDFLHMMTFGGGIGLDLRFLGRFSAELFGGAGYYYGVLKNPDGNIVSGGNIYINGGGDLSFLISPSLKIGVGVMYKHYFGNETPLMQNLGIHLGLSYSFPINGELSNLPSRLTPSLLKIESVNTGGIFPVFYQYYDNHPIGSLILSNGERKAISDIKISVFVKRYMDSPKVYILEEGLKRNETREVDLYALFNENVLEITEGTKTAAEISIEYKSGNDILKIEHIETLKLENRNASIWDDDRRAAAFVTAKDPAILKFAKNTASIIRENTNQSFDYNLRMALAIHESLNLNGLTYIVDPNTPFIEFNENKNAVDFLQFPRQTLEYKAGDCDDLSILYASLLESVSVETAFITVPGHIYIAVALDIGLATAEDLFSNFEDLILLEDKVWLPIEVTQVEENFRTAWKTGAREWNEFFGRGEAHLYPIKDAWQVFEPVGLPGGSDDVDIPDDRLIQHAYTNELAALTLREISDKEADLLDRIEESGNNIKLINKLGVLYAKYGLLEKAQEQFEKVLEQRDFAPTLLNLGNIYYLKNDLIRSLSYYKRADILKPDNSSIMLGIARVNHSLENYELAEKQIEKLRILDPDTAGKYAFLGTSDDNTRAGRSDKEKEVMLWED